MACGHSTRTLANGTAITTARRGGVWRDSRHRRETPFLKTRAETRPTHHPRRKTETENQVNGRWVSTRLILETGSDSGHTQSDTAKVSIAVAGLSSRAACGVLAAGNLYPNCRKSRDLPGRSSIFSVPAEDSLGFLPPIRPIQDTRFAHPGGRRPGPSPARARHPSCPCRFPPAHPPDGGCIGHFRPPSS